MQKKESQSVPGANQGTDDSRRVGKSAAEKRAERLKSELRANLARRKVQARARREGEEDDRPGDLLSAPKPVDKD
ncbi:hypothetical protein JJB09_10095 [Rhizobium sp. KVB221]|uniref:Uncharacterized protein n=1 Tax=Rhizobium setariae TaxID=2801340 RepID=A0A936YQI9_9HYPH|nr:hypothetical protein [Rhizobium setariae]MBL0372379.1 hypothetical protein [Rhizobium setariae]